MSIKRSERPTWTLVYVTLLVPALLLAGWALGQVRRGDAEPLSVASLLVTALVYGGAAFGARYAAVRLIEWRRSRTASGRTEVPASKDS